jgi:hypothetical protein
LHLDLDFIAPPPPLPISKEDDPLLPFPLFSTGPQFLSLRTPTPPPPPPPQSRPNDYYLLTPAALEAKRQEYARVVLSGEEVRAGSRCRSYAWEQGRVLKLDLPLPKRLEHAKGDAREEKVGESGRRRKPGKRTRIAARKARRREEGAMAMMEREREKRIRMNREKKVKRRERERAKKAAANVGGGAEGGATTTVQS